MKITYELDLNTFEAWSGGEDTLNRVINEGKVNQLESILEELYPDGLDETSLNDILWFENEWVYEMCGIRTETEIREELEEAKEEQEAFIEKQKEKREENEELLEDMPMKEMLHMEQLKDEIKQEIKNIVSEMKLVAEDIKGAVVDKNI